jgi:hypothetical protein
VHIPEYIDGLFGRARHIWEDNIKMNFKDIFCRGAALFIAMETIRLPKMSSFIVQKTVSRMLGDRWLNVIRNVPLPNNTVSKIIDEARCNGGYDFFKGFTSSKGFAVQADMSTDATDLSILLAFVRYVYNYQ